MTLIIINTISTFLKTYFNNPNITAEMLINIALITKQYKSESNDVSKLTGFKKAMINPKMNIEINANIAITIEGVTEETWKDFITM